MRRHLLVVALLMSVGASASPLLAQERLDSALARMASAAAGRVHGIVIDDRGVTLGGVSVLAMGTALAMVRTDGAGRFDLVLPPGEYVLRATREGYISTYREPVRIQSDVALRRSITLLRTSPAPALDEVEIDPEPMVSEPADHSHTETAWRLRHLSRTVLRDTGGQRPYADQHDWPRTSSVWGDLRWSGQVNFITTSALAAGGAMSPAWPRGVAHVVIGAPVGRHGQWSVRAARAGGELPSWTFLGEYTARSERAHAFSTGFSFSSQAHAPLSEQLLSLEANAHSRRVGRFYANDHWTMHRRVTLDYGGRIDRYDYLAEPTLLSGHLGARLRLAPRLAVVGLTSPHMVAPGADMFLPPTAPGPWLPPERTFSALIERTGLRPERVFRKEAGIDLSITRARVITIRRFSERTSDQIATLFGLDDASQVGHYYVGNAGDVGVRGWVVGFEGQLIRNVDGRIAYTAADADWAGAARRLALRRVAASVVRRGFERSQDLQASVKATMPTTSTVLAFEYRLNTAFGVANGGGAGPDLSGRFNLQVQQPLPFTPIRRGELNLLVSVRTLLRDLGSGVAYYDELLTLAPPTRFSCGLQMRF
jgi:hypothetical protein